MSDHGAQLQWEDQLESIPISNHVGNRAESFHINVSSPEQELNRNVTSERSLAPVGSEPANHNFVTAL